MLKIVCLGDGTVKALENNTQQHEGNQSYYLLKELWIKIFSWVLSDKLTHKPALLHLLPYQDRRIDTVEKSFNHLLVYQLSLKIQDVEAAAPIQLDDEWDELMRPTI
jgi:hypothetical protein